MDLDTTTLTTKSEPTQIRQVSVAKVMQASNDANFKVIANYDHLELEKTIFRTWVTNQPRSIPVYISHHGTSDITEVHLGQSHMIGNSLIDLSNYITSEIGRMFINADGRTCKFEFNSESKPLLDPQIITAPGMPHADFAQFEINTSIHRLKSTTESLLKDLDESTKKFGGCKFYATSEYSLRLALQDEGLEDDPRFKRFQSTSVLNIDALGQIAHRQRYNTAQSLFTWIAEYGSRITDFIDLIKKCNEFRMPINLEQAQGLTNFEITSKAIKSNKQVTAKNSAFQSTGKYFASVVDDSGVVIAYATVWIQYPNTDKTKQAYELAIKNGADPKGGIVLYELTSINKDAPKGTQDKLKKLIDIIFAKSNCETLVEVSADLDSANIISETFSLRVERSQLAATRLIRLAAGQIYLAKARSDEIINSDLSESEKDHLCEKIGADLNGWFQMALSSLMPVGKIGLYAKQTESEEAQMLHNEWSQWVTNSPLYLALANIKSSSTNSQFWGQDWFNVDNKSTPNNLGHVTQDAQKIIDAISISSMGMDAYVAEYQLSTLTPSIRQSLTKILQRWRIDDNNPNRQMGFEWTITEEELLGYLKKESAVVQILIIDQKPAGIMISFTNIENTKDLEQKMPSIGGGRASRKWCKDKGVPYEDVMYCYFVAIDRDIRDELEQKDIPGYEMIIDSLEQTASWLGVNYALGGVRIDGKNHKANLAMTAHLRNGWTPEPYRFTSRIGSKLTLVSREIPEKTAFDYSHCYSVFCFPDASNLNLVLGDPAKIAKADRLDTNAIRTDEEAANFANIWLAENKLRHCHAVGAHGQFSGGQNGVTLYKNLTGDCFYQVIPGKDRWLNKKIKEPLPFRECLEWFKKEALKPPY